MRTENIHVDKEMRATAFMEYDLSGKAIRFESLSDYWKHLHQFCSRLAAKPQTLQDDALYVAATLEYADLSFALGQGLRDSAKFLLTAKNIASQLGDVRSHSLINLHLGRLFQFAKQRSEAMNAFEEGKAEVESLGDEDIKSRAAEFIGLYYFVQGMFPEAKSHFEIATTNFETGGWRRIARNPSGPIWLSYCNAFLGHFHEAIGTLDYHRRLALDRSEYALSITFRAVLGIILAMIKNVRESEFHLAGALNEATVHHNWLAAYFARGGLAYIRLLQGRLKECSKLFEQGAATGEAAGLVAQYSSPMFLETVYALNRAREGYYPFQQTLEFERIMREPNIHLQGVAWRLKAVEEAEHHESDEIIESDLKLSEKCLFKSGDPIQLAKTWIEMARLHIRRGNTGKARVLAQKAWKGFSGYGNVFYPDDLRHLIAIKNAGVTVHEPHEENLELFINMIQELAPDMDIDTEKLFNKTVAATNRIFGAERGCIFWFGTKGNKKSPVPRGLCNLSPADIEAEAFRPNLTLVFKAIKENKPQRVTQEGSDQEGHYATKAILCIPITAQDGAQGVLYHDNSYVRDCFDHFSNAQLLRIARYLANYIDNIFTFGKRLKQRTADYQNQMQQTDTSEIITESPIMLQILSHADRIAASESPVLILGETGVGKELFAKQIHLKSPRHKRPYIVVDMTSIPENLFESELFGHEKGSFTGADRQHIGRMEMAHGGTLFIDEIGETPKAIQAKLLRVLQEKTLYRIGGNTPISSDFRLVAATNRDLAAEVAAGNFREDLYYRLNALPLILPPLRERKEDILLLAKYYLDRFANKYADQMIELSPQDEKKLMAYDWPGNVRELKNVIERAVLLWDGDHLTFDLPQSKNAALNTLYNDTPTLDEIQRRYIRHVLTITKGKMSGPGGAAGILGMKRTSLHNRMIKLGMRQPSKA